MHADGVDPRDVTWEVSSPVYRVYFWHRPKAPPEVPLDEVGYHCDEYRLIDADDVHEVLTWAEARRQGSDSYTLYVETNRYSKDDGGVPGLLRLAGIDPTVATDDSGDSGTVTVWLPGTNVK